MADQRVRACIQRVEDAERQASQFSTMLSETRAELHTALQEIMDGVNGSSLPDSARAQSSPTSGEATLQATSQSERIPAQTADQPPLKHAQTKDVMAAISSGSRKNAESQAILERTQDLQLIADETAERLGITGEDVMNAFACFSRVDVDNSGRVSSGELHKLLEEVTGTTLDKTTAKRILKKFDKDKNGELDFEEFLYCFCYTPEKKMEHLKVALYSKDDNLDQRFRTRMVGVAAEDLKKYLRKELDEESAFLSIPLVFLLFMFFILAVSLHRTTYIMNSVERAVEYDITENANFAFVGAAPFENGRMGHKNIYDVNSFADFWSWLDMGLAPLFFPSGWSTSEVRSNVAARCTAPLAAMASWAMTKGQATANTPYGPYANASYASAAGDLGPNLCSMDDNTFFPTALNLDAFESSTKAPYLFFNEIIGGMRLRQEQLREVECERTDFYTHTYNTPCMEVNEKSWFPPDLDMVASMDDDLVNRPGGETTYFRSGMDLAEVHSGIRSLENKRWLNQRTGKIEITFVTYNPQVDMLVLVYINLFVSRGGRIHKIIKPISFPMKPYNNPVSYFVDSAFALLVLHLFVVEARQICLSIKEHGFRKGLKDYFYDFKNIIDWLGLGYSTIVFVLWANWCLQVSEMSNLLLTANTSVKGSWESADQANIYTASNASFWKEIDKIVSFERLMQNALAFYPLLLALRFVSAFSAQPRLSLVTRTLSNAAGELVHFGVVMGVTIMTFTASALILFGREVEDFDNFGRAFLSVVQGLLDGFDYDPMAETGRLFANVWWSLFTVLVNLCMLNMVLAIIMDNYAEVKSSIMSGDLEDFPTIWTQSSEIFRRWNQKRKGLRLGLNYILRLLEEHDAEEVCIRTIEEGNNKGTKVVESKLITVSTFLHLVAGLEKKQAERLLTNARNYYESKGGVTADVQDCLVSLRRVDLMIQEVQAMTELLEDQGETHLSPRKIGRKRTVATPSRIPQYDPVLANQPLAQHAVASKETLVEESI